MTKHGGTGLFVTTVFFVYFEVVASLQCYSCPSLKTANGCQNVSNCGQDKVCMLRRTINNSTQEILYESRCEPKLECDKELDRYRTILTALVGRKREIAQVSTGDICLIQCCDQDLCNNGCIKPTDLPSAASVNVASNTKPPLLPSTIVASNTKSPFLPSTTSVIIASNTKPPLPALSTALASPSTNGSLITHLTSKHVIPVPTKPPKTSTKPTSQTTISTSIPHPNNGIPPPVPTKPNVVIPTSAISSITTTTSYLQASITSTYIRGSTTGQLTQGFSEQSHPPSSIGLYTPNGTTTLQSVPSTAISTQGTNVYTSQSNTSTLSPAISKPTVMSPDVSSNQSTTSTTLPSSISHSKPTVLSTDVSSNQSTTSTTLPSSISHSKPTVLSTDVSSNQSTTSTPSTLSISDSKPTVLSTASTSSLLQTTTKLLSKPECPDGSVIFEHSCYMFVKHEMSFRDAKAFCAGYQSHLVHVDSARENEFLKKELERLQRWPIQFWIGITDEETEGVWKFYDDGKLATFYDWFPGEPDGTQTFDGNANADCAVFDPFLNYQWRDEDCSPYHYSEPICEMGYQ